MNTVDIIMPTYNAEPVLIQRAIRSVLDQSYQDWKLYVAKDGGHTDLADLRSIFPDERIHFLDFLHRGKPATLNDTLRQSSSRYIAYLDDDDLWYTNHLEIVMAVMQEKDVRFVYTDAHEILSEREGDRYEPKVWSVLGKGVLTDVLLWRISHINSVHERSLLEEAGWYDEERSFFIDWDMFVRMAKINKPYHCQQYTCQHWIYPKRVAKEGTISGIHAKDPSLSEKAFFELAARAFEIVDADGFVQIIHDLKWRDEYKEKTGEEFSETDALRKSVVELTEEKKQLEVLVAKNQRQIETLLEQRDNLLGQRNDLLNSLSWKITEPIRFFGRLMGLPQGISAESGKQRILFIAPRLPEFDRASGDLRLYKLLQILTERYAVSYYNDGMWERFLVNGDKKYLNALQEIGVDVILNEAALVRALKINKFISVITEFYNLSLKYNPTIKRYCPKAFTIVDSVDVHFMRERIMAETYGDETLVNAANKTREKELEAYSQSDGVWVVSDLDKDALVEGKIESERVRIVPNIHPVAASVPPLQDRKQRTLLFIGGFVHKPNVDAMEYFYRDVFPLVRERVAGTRLVIVGDSPPEQIRKMAGPDVEVLGFVPKTQPYLDSATISIAPLRYGAGLKGKVGEALASGLPLVTSSIGAQGMSLESGQHCFIADNPEEFADSIARILRDRELWRQFSENGQTFMREHFGYESVKASLLDLFSEISKTSP